MLVSGWPTTAPCSLPENDLLPVSFSFTSKLKKKKPMQHTHVLIGHANRTVQRCIESRIDGFAQLTRRKAVSSLVLRNRSDAQVHLLSSSRFCCLNAAIRSAPEVTFALRLRRSFSCCSRRPFSCKTVSHTSLVKLASTTTWRIK